MESWYRAGVGMAHTLGRSMGAQFLSTIPDSLRRAPAVPPFTGVLPNRRPQLSPGGGATGDAKTPTNDVRLRLSGYADSPGSMAPWQTATLASGICR